MSENRRQHLFDSNVFLTLDLLWAKEEVDPYYRARKINGEFYRNYEEQRQNPDKFYDYTRMSVETFDYILETIKSDLESGINPKSFRGISPAEKLYITLGFLASGQPFKRLSLSFRMGKTTVANIVSGTCKAIWKNLVHLHMPKPTEELLKNITEKYYEKWQFPSCVGAIDGKHCRIKNPKFAGSSHYNYKHFFSMHLQAVADADKRFICIEVGGRGKQSDAGTFHYSNLNRLLQSNNYNIPGPQYLPSSDIVLPMVFIGDEGYPLKTYLMRPYPQSVLNAQNELFNKRLSRARKTIECAFGILRSKWHIFRSPIETNKCHARLLIKTCCLLHNIIRDKDGDNDIAYCICT